MLLGGGEASAVGAADRSYAVLHGLYWLTSNLAEQAPLLLAVDDAHWADVPSLRFLHYLARRVEDLPVLMVVALRPTEPEARAELTARMRTEPPATVAASGAAQPARGGEARARSARRRAGAAVLRCLPQRHARQSVPAAAS